MERFINAEIIRTEMYYAHRANPSRLEKLSRSSSLEKLCRNLFDVVIYAVLGTSLSRYRSKSIFHLSPVSASDSECYTTNQVVVVRTTFKRRRNLPINFNTNLLARRTGTMARSLTPRGSAGNFVHLRKIMFTRLRCTGRSPWLDCGSQSREVAARAK